MCPGRQSRPAQPYRRCRRLLLVAASLLVTLGLLEVGGRIYAKATDRERGVGFAVSTTEIRPVLAAASDSPIDTGPCI